MALRLFNTLTRELEEFTPLDPGGRKVGIYCCGPTVHDLAHIGNFRTFLFADLLRRYLEFKGYAVHHVMNITDVEDKIIARVRSAKIPLGEYTRRYEEAFLEDFDTLGCLRAHQMPRATEHIQPIIELIARLMDQGLAYAASDGSVYFSISKYQASGRHYGKLLNLNFDEMRPGERVSSDDYEKESVADFALWKARVPEDGEVAWASPWGEGRPGWHIECSAMSMQYLGASFDLHLGGEDLIFPHHEDEIAQSEGAGWQPDQLPFVRYWFHAAHLMVEGKKMSKSLGNFFTLRDLLSKGITGREIRHLLLTAHYREPFNFTLDGLSGARSSLERLDECLLKLKELVGSEPEGTEPDADMLARFAKAMDQDLNVSAAWGSLFEWVRDTNRKLQENRITPAQAAAALVAWRKIDAVLGTGAPLSAEAPREIQAMAEERQAARKAKDFKRADRLRDEIKAQGWIIEDTPNGPRLKRE